MNKPHDDRATRRNYTGVDKLILAAMVDDPSAAAVALAQFHAAAVPQTQATPQQASSLATGAGGYIPTGRGIGYFGGLREASVHIPTPSNKSELELYRLLERANLLNYFGTFLSYGGDDVQQLHDADEDEFIEIMSLVGMTRKPLHVRRLQKALIEWRENRDYEINLKGSQASYVYSASQTSLDSSIYLLNQSNSNHHSHINVNSDSHNSRQQYQQQTVLDNSSLSAESPAPTPNSCSSQSVIVVTSEGGCALSSTPSYPYPPPPPPPSSQSSREQRQYTSPREFLVGAPKRARLMDNLQTSAAAAAARASTTQSSATIDTPVKGQASHEQQVGSAASAPSPTPPPPPSPASPTRQSAA